MSEILKSIFTIFKFTRPTKVKHNMLVAAKIAFRVSSCSSIGSKLKVRLIYRLAKLVKQIFNVNLF